MLWYFSTSLLCFFVLTLDKIPSSFVSSYLDITEITLSWFLFFHEYLQSREQEIRAAEERLLEKDIPRNAEEFEKLVRSSPNSSYVWIKYMAYMLSLADVEKARSIAERCIIYSFCRIIYSFSHHCSCQTPVWISNCSITFSMFEVDP